MTKERLGTTVLNYEHPVFLNCLIRTKVSNFDLLSIAVVGKLKTRQPVLFDKNSYEFEKREQK